jgi:hypothetical protein
MMHQVTPGSTQFLPPVEDLKTAEKRKAKQAKLRKAPKLPATIVEPPMMTYSYG